MVLFFVSYVAFAVVCGALDQPNNSSRLFNYTSQIRKHSSRIIIMISNFLIYAYWAL
jgi:hypothetical protein